MKDHMEGPLQWFQGYRHSNLTQEVLVGLTEETAVPIRATVPSSRGTMARNDAGNMTSRHFNFVFRRADIFGKNIKIVRGLCIWWEGAKYIIALADKKHITYYNDPHRLDIVIQTVLSSEAGGEDIHP